MSNSPNSTGGFDTGNVDIVNRQIDIISMLAVLLKKSWIIVLTAVIAGGLCFTASKLLVTPTYRASFTAYVNNRSQLSNYQDTISSNDLTAAEKLVSAYSKTITSRNILERSALSARLDFDYAALKDMVTTQVESDTGIITVYVVDTSPEGAYNLATAIATVAPNQISDIIEGSSMKIIDLPTMPTTIYKPSYIKNTAAGVLAGAFLAVAYIIIRILMDDKVKNESDLETRFSLPVVGVIPDMLNASKGNHSYYDYEYAYRYSDMKRSNGGNGEKQ